MTYLPFGKKAVGRPPVVSLSDSDLTEIKSYYLPTNRNKKEGSMLLAWVRFCESRPNLEHLVRDHMPATTIPTAVVEACRNIKALVGPARGGAPRLRHESAYVPGTMRLAQDRSRRLWAGEQASVDDATRNVACYIPWPWGGCPCSDRYGVRLGRWQTLIVHDDATSFIPFVSSVFRWSQSYRGTDAAAVMFRAETEVCQFDRWVIEGGVWQSKRALAVLGGRFISAKGRPNQKLVENYIGRLWTVMAGQRGDVGRHRAEIKAASDLYMQCHQGRQDPRKHFMSLTEGQEALYESIKYTNEKRIVSREYGSWVPLSRWEADNAVHPRHERAVSDDFLVLPCAEKRKVHRGSVRVTETGPLGVRMLWSFQADWLWHYEGREVTIYFDPLADWPVPATITLAGSTKALGQAECVCPFGESSDGPADMVKAIRQSMMTETRNLLSMHTARTVRHASGVVHSATPVPAPAVAPAPGRERIHLAPLDMDPRGTRAPIDADPRAPRETAAQPARATREDLSMSLSRRARQARELVSP